MDKFAELLPFTEATLPLAVTWVLAALRPSLPRPIAYLTGEQGTGKKHSWPYARRPPRRSPRATAPSPRKLKDLGVTTSAGWMLALDNLSGVPRWLSDALCRVVTGDAQISRALYSDDDVSVLVYQRPVLLAAIDVGALRNDLAERMMPIELAPITKRRTITDLWGAYELAHPQILGVLLDLAVLVWVGLPAAAAALTNRPRMADFAELLHALDRVASWRGLKTFHGAQDDLVDAVLDGQPVTAALREWATSPAFPAGGWTGTMTELNVLLSARSSPGERWPQTAAVLSARLKQSAPAFAPAASVSSPRPVTNTAGSTRSLSADSR